MNLVNRLRYLLDDKGGATVIEYALICGLIVLVMVVGFSAFGEANRSTWGTISSQMTSSVNQATGG